MGACVGRMAGARCPFARPSKIGKFLGTPQGKMGADHLIEIAARWHAFGTMVLFVLLNLNVLALKIVQRDTHAGQIIDALCSYHEPTRRCLDRALTRWGNRPGPCGNGSSMRSWVRVALSGGVLPAFLPVAGLPCPPSSFSWARDATGEDGKAVHLAKWARPPSGSFTVSRAPPPMEHTLRQNVLPR